MKILGAIKLEKLTTYTREKLYTKREDVSVAFGESLPIDFIKEYDEKELIIPSSGIVLYPNTIYMMRGKDKFDINDQLQFNDRLIQYGISGKVLSIKDPDEDGYREVNIIVEVIEPVVVYYNIDLLWIVGESDNLDSQIHTEEIIDTEEETDGGASENI